MQLFLPLFCKIKPHKFPITAIWTSLWIQQSAAMGAADPFPTRGNPQLHRVLSFFSNLLNFRAQCFLCAQFFSPRARTNSLHWWWTVPHSPECPLGDASRRNSLGPDGAFCSAFNRKNCVISVTTFLRFQDFLANLDAKKNGKIPNLFPRAFVKDPDPFRKWQMYGICRRSPTS